MVEDRREILVGVDGGASNCRLRLEDRQGNLLGCGKSGLASIKWSIDETWNSILEAFFAAAQEANLDLQARNRYSFYLGCGLAGCEIAEARQEFLAKSPAIFAETYLESDAYTACLGAHAGADGAIVIVGTGVVGVQIEHGKAFYVGGWGFPHGDEGSAAWLGMELIRMTTQWWDSRYHEDSPLLRAVLSKFENSKTNLVTWANQANAKAFATLAPLIIEHGAHGDVNAQKLLGGVATELDKVNEVLLRNATQQNLPCCLLGGLAPLVEPWLSDQLRNRLTQCQNDATVGAVLMVRDRLAASGGRHDCAEKS